MRNSVLSIIVSGLVGLGATSLATAAEAPTITSAQANAPGMITIAFSHSGGTGEEKIAFRINEVIGDEPEKIFPADHPGIKSLLGLKPGTDYQFSVCALYLDTGEEACTKTEKITTPAAEQANSSNFPPPVITGQATTTSSVTVFWGATGSYPVIIARLMDAGGREVAQQDIKNILNRSYTFQLAENQEGVDYLIGLKGCNNANAGASTCGPWSANLHIRTRGTNDCARYVQNAMAAVSENKRLNCQYTGDQWAENPDDHLAWCKGLADANLDAIGLETAAREQAIQACIKNNEKKSLACIPYVQKAMADVRANQNLKCGNTGDRWSTDQDHHMNWCMDLAKADQHFMGSETATREQAIKNCTGITREQRGDLGGSGADPKYQKNTDMPGSDYSSFETTKAADAECSIACSKDERCVAWTWVRPGIQAPKGKCWLKNAEPAAVANNCCISGLKSKYRRLGKKP